MKVICAWCGAVISDGDESEGVSHGICSACKAKQDAELDAREAARRLAEAEAPRRH